MPRKPLAPNTRKLQITIYIDSATLNRYEQESGNFYTPEKDAEEWRAAATKEITATLEQVLKNIVFVPTKAA